MQRVSIVLISALVLRNFVRPHFFELHGLIFAQQNVLMRHRLNTLNMYKSYFEKYLFTFLY